MKSILIWLAGGTAIILGLWALYLLYKEYKEATAETPNDTLYNLEWKIEASLLDYHSELYFIHRIKELRNHPEIDQKRLNELDIKFRQRFQELHMVDEHSPENLDDENTLARLQREKDWKHK